MSEMLALYTCPHCGQHELDVVRDSSGSGVYLIKCNTCGAMTSFDGEQSKERVEACWNRRDHNTSTVHVQRTDRRFVQ